MNRAATYTVYNAVDAVESCCNLYHAIDLYLYVLGLMLD